VHQTSHVNRHYFVNEICVGVVLYSGNNRSGADGRIDRANCMTTDRQTRLVFECLTSDACDTNMALTFCCTIQLFCITEGGGGKICQFETGGSPLCGVFGQQLLTGACWFNTSNIWLIG